MRPRCDRTRDSNRNHTADVEALGTLAAAAQDIFARFARSDRACAGDARARLRPSSTRDRTPRVAQARFSWLVSRARLTWTVARAVLRGWCHGRDARGLVGWQKHSPVWCASARGVTRAGFGEDLPAVRVCRCTCPRPWRNGRARRARVHFSRSAGTIRATAGSEDIPVSGRERAEGFPAVCGCSCGWATISERADRERSCWQSHLFLLSVVPT